MKLTVFDRIRVCFRSTFLQGSWNFERMQNGGWCFAMMPALKKLYQGKELKKAVKRNLAFFNTQPYMAAPIYGVLLKMEEDRANGQDISEKRMQEVKEGMMGPLASVGDPVFWFAARPIISAICATYAIMRNFLGAVLFFLVWNIMRYGFMWVTQEMGYQKGTSIIEELSNDFLNRITKIASIFGIFTIGVLIQRYVKFDIFNLTSLLTKINLDSYTIISTEIVPNFTGFALVLLCSFLLKKKVSPVLLLILMFVLGVVLHFINIL